MTQETMAKLYYAYQMPGRFFHNIHHISECFKELTEAMRSGVVVENELALRRALWFHDYIYDGRRNDCEELSADAAAQSALDEGHSEEFAARVHRYVMVTKHTDEYAPVTPDEKLIVDIDLCSLALPDFDAVSEAIRKEYAFVPDEVFWPARKAILRKFLERGRIYHTEYFHVKHETMASRNLVKAVNG